MEVPQIQYIDKAVDIQVVCVPETCNGSRDCRDFEGDRRMRLILLFGIPTPGARRCGRIQRMRVEDCIQQIRERGDARAHECQSMDVDDPCDEVQLVLPKVECTSKRRVLRTLDIQCIQQVTHAMSTTTPFAVIVDNACFQTKGANCRLVETRAKWQ